MQVFSELVRSIQKAQAELVLVIEEKQRQTERRAEGLITELEQEISELKTRHTALENVNRTDHIHFLKARNSLLKCNFVVCHSFCCYCDCLVKVNAVTSIIAKEENDLPGLLRSKQIKPQ